MSDFITVLRDTCPTPVLDATRWQRIGGDPHTVNLNAYLSADGSKIMGTWICTPGKFQVNYEKWEYCHFLDGYCVITPEGEPPIHLRAGDLRKSGRNKIVHREIKGLGMAKIDKFGIFYQFF